MLELRNIFKNYEGQPLLKGVSLNVSAGETVCLLGSSGSGKSTLLRIIAGLEEQDGGEVLWEGEDIHSMPVHKRNFGLMFQDYALFPNRSVEGNVAFGLRMQGLAPELIREQVKDALQKVDMEGLAGRKVTDLSGGEQQRVALARALAPRPRLLMLDEPLGALDRTLREQLSEELRRLLHATGIPALYVTHDQEEAFTIADRLVLLNNGRMEQTGTPEEVYNHPASTWVAAFFGLGNLLPGVIRETTPLTVQTEEGVFMVGCDQPENPAGLVGDRVMVLFKPGGLHIGNSGGGVENCLKVRVKDSIFRGEGYRVDVLTGCGKEFRLLLDRPLSSGDEVTLYVQPDCILCLPGAE